jgi:hypothetical protein
MLRLVLFGAIMLMRCNAGGSAGTVYVCKAATFRSSRYRPRMEDRVRVEVEISRHMSHAHLSSTVGTYKQGKNFTVVQLPVFGCGTLQDLFDTEDTLQSSIELKWFGCLASALCYIH